MLKYYPPNAFRVCIDESGTDIAGRIYTPLSPGAIRFKGIGRMLLEMDKRFDRAGYPQSFQEKRTFDDNRNPGENRYSGIPQGIQGAEEINNMKGVYDTIDIVVESRRNTTWQGCVYTPHGNFRADFKGEVELLNILLSKYRDNS